jgi:hypothetical protein
MAGYVTFGRGRRQVSMPVHKVRELRDNMMAQARAIDTLAQAQPLNRDVLTQERHACIRSARRYNHLAIRALREDIRA